MAKASKNILQFTEEMEMSPIITVDTSTQLIRITSQKENLRKTKNLIHITLMRALWKMRL